LDASTFSHSGGADHQNIFGEHIFRHFGREFLPAHAVAQRDGDRAFCGGLSDDVLVQLDDDFARSEFVERRLNRGLWFVLLAGKIDHHGYSPPLLAGCGNKFKKLSFRAKRGISL
jgi:hypothetical protein